MRSGKPVYFVRTLFDRVPWRRHQAREVAVTDSMRNGGLTRFVPAEFAVLAPYSLTAAP